MEELGRLAAGIAHDFNNLLTAITAHVDLWLDRMAADDPGRTSAEEVRRMARRAVSLVRQILSFSHKRSPVPQTLDLNLVVGEMVRMLRRVIGETIAIEAVLEPGLGSIRADLGQIEHALLNLAVNARDAMPRGGRLALVTAQVDATRGAPPADSRGPWAMLSVEDTRGGTPPPAGASIPGPAASTGGAPWSASGLIVVREIVEENGGRLEVESGARGAIVRLFFPVVSEAGSLVGTPSSPASAVEGTETVLIIEDEDAVRRVLAESLQLRGYAVLEARDGDEALSIAEGQAIPIQGVITDLVLPGMPASEIARRVKPLHPEARFVFISGYERPAGLHGPDGDPDVVFLAKPFSLNDLAGALRGLLDG
jgi:CheY-like chemotaxis protein